MPYYIITDTLTKNGDKPLQKLVNAKTKAQAISAVVQPRFSAVVADSKDLIDLSKAGVESIEASAN